ncbi:MAG: polysaccharide lyase family 1 protein [Planctomycetaceae bacterium]
MSSIRGSLLLGSALIAVSAASAAPLRVELNGDNGRNDVRTRGWTDWRIPMGQARATAASGTFGDVRLTLRAVGDGATIASDWWKRGFDFEATLASDGASLPPGDGTVLELVIEGLSVGRHSLASWHSAWSQDPAVAFDVAVDGRDVAKGVRPAHRVEHDDEAAVVFAEFDAAADRPVTVRFAPAVGGESGPQVVRGIFLNGLVIDGADPRPQARRPVPADGDEHAVESPLLHWLVPGSAVECDVYLGTDRAAVEAAMPGSREHLGRTKATTMTAAQATRAARREAQSPNLDWFWRVDTVDREGHVAAGPVWRFRVGVPAFATAEGHGQLAAGGRGGRVLAVTNLDDSGPGSLREAIDAEGPRTIVFRVGGTIPLKSKLIVRNPYVTIAGQTAPGDGICVRGYTFGCLGAHDVVIRHVRIRVGDESGETQDGTGLASCDHSIIDHCSVSWSIDEGVSSRSGKNITVQRCLVAEALNIANHRKYQPGKGHSFAGSISGDVGSFHHNLLAHRAGRNWSLAGGLSRGGRFAGRLDIRNNVVYNWESRTTDGGVKALTFVGNHYIPGPATRVFHLVKPDTGSPADPQQYFIAGNRMVDRPQYDADNWANGGVVVAADAIPLIRLERPFCESLITEHTADEAYASVMADVGANRPRLDEHDRRIVREVAERSFSVKGSRGGLPGIIDTQADVGGWPDLKSGPVPADADGDGLADDWEKAHGLDPASPADGNAIPAGSDLTNLERYLDHLATTPGGRP